MLDAVTQIQEQKQNQEVAIPDEEELFGHMSEGEDDADAEKVDLRNVDIITNNVGDLSSQSSLMFFGDVLVSGGLPVRVGTSRQIG